MLNKRARILVYPQKYIILTNYKCAFTSLNYEINPQTEPDIVQVENAAELHGWLNTNSTEGMKVLLICRNPYDRMLSFFRSWLMARGEDFVSRRRGKKIQNFAYRNLRRVMSIVEYTRFKESIIEDAVAAFHIFMEKLDGYYLLNAHTHPQDMIYTHNGNRIISFNCILRLDAFDDELFRKVTQHNLPRINSKPGRENEYMEYFDEKSLRLFNGLYEGDFQDLGYKMHETFKNKREMGFS